jgi:large subunit ribosomal protein L19
VSKDTTSSQQHQLSAKPEEEERSQRPTRPKTVQQELEDNFAPYRYIYPEFLPQPELQYRNRIREKLERGDMLARRANIDIPEFYVGK